MSQLLDSLRKTHGTPATSGTAPGRVESVVASLGVGAPPRRRGAGLLRAGAAALVLAAVSAFTLAWQPDPAGIPQVLPRTPLPSTAASVSVPERQVSRPPAAGPEQVPGAKRAPEPIEDFRRAVRSHRAGDLTTAAELYRSLLGRDVLRAQVHNNLGLIYQSRGQFEAAGREFELALTHDPGYAKAHNNFGVVLLAQDRADAAIARFRAAAALDRGDPGPTINLALAQKAAGLPEQAKETLLLALGASPHSAPAHYNLAVLYDASGERTRAVEHYRAFLEHRGTAYASQAMDVRARLAALDTVR